MSSPANKKAKSPKNKTVASPKGDDQSNTKNQPQKVTKVEKKQKKNKAPEPEVEPEVAVTPKSTKKQKKEKQQTPEPQSSLSDFFASKSGEQNESLFSAFSQIAPTSAPKFDVQKAVEAEKKKLEEIEKIAEQDEKDEAADIEKQIDAEIKEQEKSEKFLSSEQKTERDKRSIFIGNVTTTLPPKKLTKELKKQFSKYGNIESIRFRSVAFSKPGMNKIGWINQELHEKRDSMNAYLVFETEESVEKALAENGTMFLGKHIRVDYANHDPKREKFTLFVGNLPYDVSEETLRAHFAECGGITNVHIVRATGVGMGKGVAFVSFSDVTALKSALAMDGSMFGTRALRVCRPSTKDKNKRKEEKEKAQNSPRGNNNNNKRKHGEQKSSKNYKKPKTGNAPGNKQQQHTSSGYPKWQGARSDEAQTNQVIKKINKHQKQFKKKE